MSSLNEEKVLLSELADGKKEAIDHIYKDNYALICKLISKNGGSTDDADDIFQEAMIVLYKKSQESNFTLNCQISTYLYAVSRRLWLKKWQKQKRFGVISNDFNDLFYAETGTDIEAHEKKESDFIKMNEALEKIGEPCKSLIKAFYIEKKSMQIIAEEFNYTNADNAKTQKYKCLIRLKKLFFAESK